MSLSKDDKRMLSNMYSSITAMIMATTTKDPKAIINAVDIDKHVSRELKKWKEFPNDKDR